MTPLMQALDLIKRSASRWAKGDANDPSPAQVLNEIVEILQKENAALAD
jgi:hypothetical protein